MTFRGQVVLVTGAGRGVGRSIACAFARAGASLALVARSQPEIEQVAREISASGVNCLPQSADVSDRSSVEGTVQAVLARFGRIDVLVNAAGVYGPIGPLVENNMDDWVRALEINLLGTVYCLRAVLPHMLTRGSGVIINLSGGGAVSPFPRFSAYSTSKAAVVRLTETVAEEVRDRGVRINAIAPGAVNTFLLDQVLAAGDAAGPEFYARSLEQKRTGGTSPEIAAELALFLSSPAAAGITGRLISAVWDDWKSLPGRAQELDQSALFTLRRIDGRNFAEVRSTSA